ncbi:MAG: hypothetical protein A2289_16360 [Deltaproteobacteria bacterium RIFOXYA12_FULL_58_15]|nr:MAG: hypothetical protein A2289_16360 [Deltaproteobacteria bacterium RIFOXYA12_FULL_58_15]OGR13655.1 MAG: hypothetical protein A2341_08775 [Deltaproteobacteria bacterium RIFOXYB12_FULL_58_9]
MLIEGLPPDDLFGISIGHMEVNTLQGYRLFLCLETNSGLSDRTNVDLLVWRGPMSRVDFSDLKSFAPRIRWSRMGSLLDVN